MNIQPFCNYTLSLFNQKFLPSLTVQEKKIVAVVSLVFSLLLATVYAYRNWNWHESKVEYFNGHGNFIAQNGDIMDGDFKNGMLHGQGKVTRVSGEVWEGEFKFNKLDGQGKKSYPTDGRVEEGTFKEGLLIESVKALINTDTL